MYVSNKEKLFQAVSNLDLVKMTNCLGSEYFWDQLPKLLECGYDQDFYNNWAELSQIENKEEKWRKVEKCINENRVFVEECFFNPTLTQLSFCVMKASVYDFFLKNCTKEKEVDPVDIFHYFAKRLLPYFYQSECNDTYSELLKYQKQEVKRLESRYDD